MLDDFLGRGGFCRQGLVVAITAVAAALVTVAATLVAAAPIATAATASPPPTSPRLAILAFALLGAFLRLACFAGDLRWLARLVAISFESTLARLALGGHRLLFATSATTPPAPPSAAATFARLV
jgi:hypothetical protein